MPKYVVSTFGRWYVTDEELDELPSTRKIFIVITFLLGSLSLLKFLLHLKSLTSRNSKTCNYQPLNTSTKRIIICYVISHLIHTIHFIDNIYRPVAYFEPKWLYDRLLISEMEITFFANFPITLSGLLVMKQFTSSVSKRHIPKTVSSCKQICWYIFGSFLTLGHYRTEPPWNYSPSTTFTIAGEGLSSFILAFWMYRYYKTVQLAQKHPDDLEENANHSEKYSKML